MPDIYSAVFAFADPRSGTLKNQEALFVAADLDDAIAATWRLARLSEREATELSDVLCEIRINREELHRIGDDGSYKPAASKTIYRWKLDTNSPPNATHSPRPLSPIRPKIYDARITFGPQTLGPRVHRIRFLAEGDTEAQADAKRWAETRHTTLPDWFGKPTNIEMARIALAPVGADGTPGTKAATFEVIEGGLAA